MTDLEPAARIRAWAYEMNEQIQILKLMAGEEDVAQPRIPVSSMRITQFIHESGVGEYFTLFDSVTSCVADHQRHGYIPAGVFSLTPEADPQVLGGALSQIGALPAIANLEMVPRRDSPSLEDAAIFNAVQPVLALAHAISRHDGRIEGDWLEMMQRHSARVTLDTEQDGERTVHLQYLAGTVIAWLADRGDES